MKQKLWEDLWDQLDDQLGFDFRNGLGLASNLWEPLLNQIDTAICSLLWDTLYLTDP